MRLGLGGTVFFLLGGIFVGVLRPVPPALVLTPANRPAEPSPASTAFAVIRPSLVVIKVGEVLGAGVIIDDSGTILTCLHVIERGRGTRIVFPDGFETAGIVVRTQPENDLAVLRPEVVPEGLVPATLGDSGSLNIGDPVVAVGNPFGLINSVSEGVVSGLGRSAKTGDKGRLLSGLIQFDAAVNPGNSGGPLLNRRGEVVGLVTALFNPTKDSFFVGIGYAVTVETAGRALEIPPW